MISHYSRSKTMLEKKGYKVWKTEQPWNRFTKVRRDLYNIMDALAINGKGPILGVQVTDSNKSHEHILKALANDYLPLWCMSGGRFEVHAWRTLLQRNEDGKRGKREKWECKITEMGWNMRIGKLEVMS